MELKTALMVLCTAFSLKLAHEVGGTKGVRDSESMALTLHTTNGIRVHCIPRQFAIISDPV